MLIIVCDNTNIAEHIYRMISDEREVEVVDEKGKVKTQIEYERGKVFPNLPSPRKTRCETYFVADIYTVSNK